MIGIATVATLLQQITLAKIRRVYMQANAFQCKQTICCITANVNILRIFCQVMYWNAEVYTNKKISEILPWWKIFLLRFCIKKKNVDFVR